MESRDIKPLIDLYFNQKDVLYQFHYNSFEYLIEQIISLVENPSQPHVVFEQIDGNKIKRYIFKFENLTFNYPADDTPHGNSNLNIYPEDSRKQHLTYSGELKGRVRTIFQEVDLKDGSIKDIPESESVEDSLCIAKIPVMVKSKFCTTQKPNSNSHTECEYDTGCYYLIKGNEKMVISRERMCDNKILVFTKKDSNFPSGLMYTVQINSKRKEDIKSKIDIISMKMLKDKSIILTMKYFTDIPIFIFFKALGFTNDELIIDNIIHDMKDNDMKNILYISIIQSESYIEEGTGIVKKINSQQDARNYLIYKLKTIKKTSETDPEAKEIQQQEYIKSILENDLLPHINGSLIVKGKYLGYMCNCLLQCILGRIAPDDRDSFINKRIDLPGPLTLELFKSFFNKLMSDSNRWFRNHFRNLAVGAKVTPGTTIKSNVIQQGLDTAFATGTFGPKRKGVAQSLGRLSYTHLIAYPRRVIAPLDSTTVKIDKPRYAHNNQFGYFTVEETPEGEKVGTHKHLALSATVTINNPKDVEIILERIKDDIISLLDVIPIEYKIKTKVFINGVWQGMCNNPLELVEKVKKFRRENIIHKYTSISFNIKTMKINIYTDGGRVVRPLLRVINNELLLTKETLEKIRNNKYKSFNEFILENPDVLEFIDIEESEGLMVAMTPQDIINNKVIMNKVINNPDKNGNTVNRYDNTLYVKYTHCELHPFLHFGSVSSNIPFINSNQAPRNYFNYAQARPAMGINASNMRYRNDNTYLLVNTQRPLVQTWGSEYTKLNYLPTGENIIVAVAPYFYNQEDSIIFNQSSIDKGLLNAISYSKVHDFVQKNPAYNANEEFKKPDKLTCTNYKMANYEKLQDNGFVKEETIIEDNDVLIGKISPIQVENNRSYRDNSYIYKSNYPAIVDKVSNVNPNIDGYNMVDIRLRSERKPIVGDKLSCYSGDTEILTTEGWKFIKDITLNDKVATLQNGDTLVYENPTEIQAGVYNGNMYYVDSNQINLLVTPNHRMWVGNRNGKNYKAMLAEDIYGKRLKYKKNVEKTNIKGLEYFELDDLKIPIDDWLWLFGIWIAEGWIHNKYEIMYATDKQRVKDKIEEVFAKTKLGIKLIKTNYDENKWYFKNKKIAEYLKPMTGAVNKYLPDFVWQLNLDQCKTLIAAMMLGDGHTMENGTERYDTSSTKLADDFQRLCLHAGWSCNKKIKYKAGHESHFSNGYIATATVDSYRLTIIKSQNNPLVNKNIKPDGTNRQDSWFPFDHTENNIFCCTVSGDGVVYVRRKGMVTWSGNSRHGQKGTGGICLRSEDLPSTESGLVPDIIINSACMPSRMTIGQLVESIYAKMCAAKGIYGDGTAFEKFNIEEIYKNLKDMNYDEHGEEIMYCGLTGKKMEAKIFITPTYYYRLKHLVLDKVHSRAKGPTQILTRQPTEGRARDGGFRFGKPFCRKQSVCKYSASLCMTGNTFKLRG
jgi:DNA-directed RNA polymerase II subunit RPB2